MEENTFLLLNDQPTTCPYCGCRTSFYEFYYMKEYYQIHRCMNTDCLFVFVAVED